MDIRIKNVSKNVTPDSLAAVFSAHGDVSKITISTNQTGGNKTAFITMPDEQEARSAINQLNGSFVDGQVLEAEEAQTQKTSVLRSCYKLVRNIASYRKKTLTLSI